MCLFLGVPCSLRQNGFLLFQMNKGKDKMQPSQISWSQAPYTACPRQQVTVSFCQLMRQLQNSWVYELKSRKPSEGQCFSSRREKVF